MAITFFKNRTGWAKNNGLQHTITTLGHRGNLRSTPDSCQCTITPHALGSYLVYWVIDVPTNPDMPEAVDGPSSRLIAIRHDATSAQLEVLWTKSLPGSVSGMPVIGYDTCFCFC